MDLVQKLQGAGLLQGGRRWRFSHDTFEEYFVASWLVTRCEDEASGSLLDGEALSKWIGNREREVEFVSVIDFVAELAEDQVKARMLALNWPDLWKRHLVTERIS
jgi:hypothetical protein